MTKIDYQQVSVALCDVLRRNPQNLAQKTMDALKASIERDGFLVPVLLRPIAGGRYEVVSGNHRFMAARDLGHVTVPAAVRPMTDSEMQRLAVNLNLIHGDPTVEQLAPFLAEMDDATLGCIHLDQTMLDQIKIFDIELSQKLADLEAPDDVATEAKTHTTRPEVTCPNCSHCFRK